MERKIGNPWYLDRSKRFRTAADELPLRRRPDNLRNKFGRVGGDAGLLVDELRAVGLDLNAKKKSNIFTLDTLYFQSTSPIFIG